MNPCPSSMHPSQGAHSRETQIDACLSNSWYRSHSWAVGIRFTGTHLYALFIATFGYEACTGSWASEAFSAYLWTLNAYQAFRKESLVLRCLSKSQYVYRNPSCSGYQPITSGFIFTLKRTYSTFDDFLPFALFPIGIEEVRWECHNDGYYDDVGSSPAISLWFLEAAWWITQWTPKLLWGSGALRSDGLWSYQRHHQVRCMLLQPLPSQHVSTG